MTAASGAWEASEKGVRHVICAFIRGAACDSAWEKRVELQTFVFRALHCLSGPCISVTFTFPLFRNLYSFLLN